MRRYNTIIFVPHARARFRKLTVSNRLLGSIAASAAALLIAAVAFGWAYLASARKDSEFRAAMAENARLRTDTRELTQKLAGLSQQMSSFEDRAKRLAVVAGLPPLPGSGGPTLPAGQDLVARSARLEGRLNDIESQIDRRKSVLLSTPTVAPVEGLLNSGFGMRRDPFHGNPAFHAGLDIATPSGQPVGATAEGVVVKAGWHGEYGNLVEIQHRSGYRTLYGHLSKILVAEGQKVERGDKIGLVGSTGRSTAPHLHYEVRVGDRLVNPLEYILDPSLTR
ncbi:MAG TPA: M23 family metallopeptidase [Thermoanaerobaculia bacterium]|jgi:murein DD-endopeptidase MepM/ murein hydrolase activator NlpD